MRFLCLLLLLLVGNAVLAQQYNFHSWTLADGLPQSQVNDIHQDHRMQIWITTNGGVSRFDGNTFYTYTTQQGLASNNTTCIFEDSQNNIWIGSSDNGLTRFDGAQFTVYARNAGLTSPNITSITEDKLGKLWVATDSGIFKLSGNQFSQLSEFKKQPYQVIYSDAKGAIWAGSRSDGLYRLYQNNLYHFSHPRHNIPSNTITAIYSGGATDKIWIGTDKGPAYIADNKPTKVPLPATIGNPAVTDFTHDAYGHILIALQHDGILSVKDNEILHLTKANGLSSDQITTLYTDTEKNTWIGTNGYGLQQHRAQWFLHYFNLGEISEPHITALAQDTKGRLWIGTANGNAGYMQQGKVTMLHTKVWPSGTTLYNMWVASPEDVWVATSQGIWNLKPGEVRHFTSAHGLPSDDIYAVVADSDNSLWFATAGGVATYQQGKITTIATADGSDPGKAYFIFKDKQNQLWVGTDKQVYLLKENKLHPVPELTNRHFGKIRSIAEGKNGWLFFGGYNYGLLAYHEKSGTTKLFNAANGLPNEGVKSLYTDCDNNLWVGTNSTLLKVDLPYFHKSQKLRFREYSGQNGFRGLEVSYNGITQTPDGKLWFGTIKGLTQYNPELDRINKATPELLLTDIRLSMQPTNWEELGYRTDPTSGLPVDLRLPHNKNHITFDFHGICLSNPAKVRYRYMLEGHDQQWSETTDHSFTTYANLSPGTYTFKLKAQNNDGYWSPQPLTYTFSVIPPVWRRQWFIAVMLLLITGAIISVVRMRERSLLKMNTLLDMRVQHRTRMLERKNREKELLLQEVHHRVKNNLQIVISLLNLQARHVKDPAALEVMQALRSRVRSMALLHERLYRHDDLEHIVLEDYFGEICESLYAAYGVTEDRVKLQFTMAPIKVDLDTAITLGLIVNELISNTLKYAFPDSYSGSLGIDLDKLHGDTYRLIVWDNGVGFSDVQDQQQSFGLKLVSSLIKKLDGSIKFDNNNGTKTILYFVLPS